MPEWLVGVIIGVAATLIVVLSAILWGCLALRHELKQHYHEREN